MRRVYIPAAVATFSAALLIGLLAATPAGAAPRLSRPVEAKANGDRLGTRLAQETIDEKIHRQGQLEIEFLRNFVSLPPAERVRLWEQGKDPSGRGAVSSAMDKALIIEGPDAVPYLADVVRHGGSYQRAHALKLLCDMDRYVPLEKLGLPGLGPTIKVAQLGSWSEGGRLDPFMIVDGRRVGKTGLEVVTWAAEQTRDKDLRFHARLYSGLLKQDVERLQIEQQVEEWRQAVAKCHGILGTDLDSHSLSEVLEGILIKEAPDSIPPLLRVLSQDSNGFVREQAITVLYQIDNFRMRLRATEIGRKTIDAIHQALDKGGLQPSFSSSKARKDFWEWFTNRVYQDPADPGIWNATLFGLQALYKVRLTITRPLPVGEAQEPLPIVHDFIGYLTKIDPYYPSWEFTFMGDPFDAVANPLFQKRIERYYQAWLKFKAQASDLRRDGTYITCR